MKHIVLTALVATVSPIAIAQQLPSDSPAPAISAYEEAAESEVLSTAPFPRAIETAIKADWIDKDLSDEVQPGVIAAARRAYQKENYGPIWTRKGSVALKEFSADLFEYGLASEDILEQDLQTLIEQRFNAETPEQKAEADLGLTSAWLRMAAAVSGGVKSTSGEDEATGEPIAYVGLSEALIASGKGQVKQSIEKYEPEYPQYGELKTALAEYRLLMKDGGWLAIQDGDVIEPGGEDARIPAIRTRLEAEGYDADRSLLAVVKEVMSAATPDALDAASDKTSDADQNDVGINPELYDDKLVEAVKTFQARHGIEPDGVVGPSTLEAMNESVESKIARIADSMNRWRKLGEVDKRYIWANIPSYTAEGWSNGKRGIEMKTIVGMESRQTPVFSDEVEYVVANPNWYAPVSIVRKDKLPKLQRDPGYAQRGNYKIYDRETGAEVSAYSVNWSDPSSAAKYRLVQQSGSGNALGELKIMFPNQYSVYLHGTPGADLFDRAERAFSSGCVRLEDPTAMAEWIASFDSAAEADEIEEAVDSRKNTRIDLESRTPIHITYMTVTVDDDGAVNFWRDIYDRTEGIEQVKKFAPIRQPVATVDTQDSAEG